MGCVLRLRTKGETMRYFFLTDKLCTENGLEHLPSSVPLTGEAVYSIPAASVDFFHKLRCSNKHQSLAKYVIVEVYSDRTVQVVDGPNLNANDVVNINIDGEDTQYGIKITGRHRQPLYVWIFYFIMSDFSVGEAVVLIV
jgi:hypothetical protein